MEALIVLAVVTTVLLGLCTKALVPVLVLGVATLGAAIWFAKRRRRGRLILLLAALLSLALLLSANWLLLEPVLRFALRRAAATSGMTVSFASASGNVWTGEISIHGLAAARSQSSSADFSIAVDRAAIDIDVRSLFAARKSIESLRVEGVRGRVDRVGHFGKPNEWSGFEIGRVDIRDVKIEFTNALEPSRPLATTLDLLSIDCQQLRSDSLAYDILFRSNARGRAGGAGFALEAADLDGWTRWRVDALPVSVLATFLGDPLTWLTAGTVDVDIRSHSDPDSATIRVAWKTVLADLRAEVPPGASLKARLLWPRVIDFLNRQSRRLPIEFEIAVPRESVQAMLTGEGGALLDLLTPALIGQIAAAAGVPLAEVAGDVAAQAVERIREWLTED